MRKAITALLLGAAAVAPALAQPAGRGELRQDRQEIRRDRTEVRQQRQDYRQNMRQGDYGEARRDQRELQRDRGELRESRQELRSDRRGDQPALADRRDDRRDAIQDRRDDRRDRVDNRQDGRRDNRWAGNQGWNNGGFGRNDRGNDWNNSRGNGWNNNRGWNDNRGWDNNRGRNDNRGWNNNWRNDRRYDWQGYRASNRRFYTLPRYYGPQGFGNYRRWGVGGRIGQPFFARNYWISDPWAYRLPPAYGNYQWVRYYDDVLLIDIYTGIVRDAQYGFFY